MSTDKDSVGMSEKYDEENRPKVDLDSILVEVGEVGRYQLRSIALTALMVIFGAWSGVEYIFTTGRISTRCLIPECDPITEAPQFTPSWILNAIPGSSATSFDNCQRYTNTTYSVVANSTCPVTLFNQNSVVECGEYVYENNYSVVYDFDMACDEWSRTMIGSIRTIGTLTALPITGFISDRWGRRAALTFNAFNTGWLGVVRYWTNSYWGFLISQVMEATFGAGGFSCSYILMMELVGPKYRVAAGATMSSFYAVGQITCGLLAWALPNWRLLTLTLYTPMLITISYFWILSESLRWHMSKGRYGEAEAILKKVAKINGKEISEKSLEALKYTVEEERRQKALENEVRAKEPWLVVQVFRNKPILIRCIVAPVWWITMTLIYYGLSVNAVNISGNQYINFIAVSAIEIPGFWIAVFFMNKVGRRTMLIVAYWICASCQIAYIFLPDDFYGVSLTVYLIGKCAIAVVVTALYVYTSELYPTKYRHSLFAFSSMIGRIGSITAPLTPAFSVVWEQLPFALFAGFALVSGLLVWITPETRGTKMADTMEEAARIGNTKSNTN